MHDRAYDAAGARLTLALLLALGLHAALLLIPGDWRSFHFPAPRRFDVVLLPPVTRPEIPEPAAAPEPVEPAPGTAAAAVAAISAPEPPQPEPVPPTEPEPIIDARPAPKPPVAPTKPPVSPHAALASAPKPATPTAPAEVGRAGQRPARPVRSGGTVPPDSGHPTRLDSAALLGQVAVIETENQRRETAGIRSKRVDPSDLQSLEGFYIAAWTRKVEQIGEMNFPEIARRLNLSTGPVLDVSIRADGSLKDVRVVRSSGHAELDRAAQQIVRLGAPYAPFPPQLRQRYDVLQISRPWRFDPGGRIQAR